MQLVKVTNVYFHGEMNSQ